ncbi:MAG: FtsQ-type POTRA domain-containing protein [Dethiobacter sp.]|jgi:cell division protein FtsQ|nr:FtsQ-type POTRA domain-containing protein [Dethiobacter sp.]MBS3900259.1 FtsQ-type POTRA domain-containing protein [Dethiobacter sp.]MBS3983495.1 FtsQ-type POTRA domain-containing protein [Dethiobacter sp.]MCL4463953.1 FtsQ-type POTRA domain-containing protein [Bacillota bacterium]MCL5992810.1 FtsQ-type POTRA domain-containing protein [Bacillota bacterium]
MDKQRWVRPVQVRKKSSIPPEKTRQIKRRLVAMLLFIVVLWTVLSFIGSDFFSIATIAIYGNTYTTESEIRLALTVAEGDNIWRLNKAQQADKLKTIPRIESARVTRELPNRLKVEIKEKRAVALVPYNGYLLVMGSDGMVLATTRNPQNYHIPMLTGLAPLELSVGEILLSGPALQEVVQTLETMSAAGVTVSELNFAEADKLVLITMDGLTVWLGQGGHSEKAALLVQIMGQLQGRQAEGYLDLRVPEAPAFKPLAEEKTQKNN